MSVTIRIPSVLQPYVGGHSEIQAEGATVREALDNLTTQHAETRAKLFDEDGKLRKHVVIMLNGEDVRFLQKLDTPLQNGDEVMVLPSMSGGRQEVEDVADVRKPTIYVQVSVPMRKYFGWREYIELEATTLRDVLQQLTAQMENTPLPLLDEHGRVCRFFVIAVNGEIVFADRKTHVAEIDRNNIDSLLNDCDEIWISPAACGGG